MTFRSGFVAVVGRPNTGKSTLVNALVGEKVSIVSDKPQTTRGRIRGVVTTESWQIVLTDTPGFHKPRTLLGRRLNDLVGQSTTDVDAVVQVVDALAGVGRGDAYVAAHRVTPLPCRKICVVNKVDAVRRPRLVAQLDAAARLAPFDHVIPASAKEERGLDVLVDELVAVLPEGPASFAPGQVTDQSLEYRVAELIREKALALTREEVPHSVAVQIEELVQEGPVTRASATLLVERDSQKGILIGKGGGMLKRIGTEARIEMEPLVGGRVFLDLRVKVLKEWQRDPAELTRLGY